MKIIDSIQEMHNTCADLRQAGKRIGLAPTMGALHDGHISLLKIAREHADISVMSLFVNPAQFAPHEDLDRYPRPFTADCEFAERNNCDILFAPRPHAMYPANYMTFVNVENISGTLEGECRISHFRGVTTIVLKLFNIINPDIAVFGQKDAQQAIILRRMVTDLNVPVELKIAPTIREKDGLALSSRNVYLTKEERSQAPTIYQGLYQAQQLHNKGELFAKNLIAHITGVYRSTAILKAEYVVVVEAETLSPVETISGKTLIAVACRTQQSNTRLIDNIVLGGEL